MDYTVDNAVEIAETANIVPMTDEQLTKAKAAIRAPERGPSSELVEAASATAVKAAPSAEQVLGAAKRHYGEKLIRALLFLAAATTILDRRSGSSPRCCGRRSRSSATRRSRSRSS